MLAGFLLLAGRVWAAEIHSPAGLSARVDEPTGTYELAATNFGWSFAGSLGAAVKNVTVNHGQDSLGAYEEISLAWNDGALPMYGRIRLYDTKPLARFSDRCGAATEIPPSPFPSFTNLPANLHVFSYRQDTFAPPQFAANDCSTPWLLFDDQADALVISPASHLMVASLLGDGERTMASGFNPQLRNLPAGFEQQTLMAFGRGINQTWDAWGRALTWLEGATRPGNDADTVLKYFGYWTDNGAFYYYNYDLDLGYAGTLAALVERYRREHIPIHYLQLDSWWYSKTLTSPEGETGRPKTMRLPQGEWNRYGGLLEYKAHPFLFTNGLDGFQRTVGLPFVTHNRWIDPASPYHAQYKISGLAAVDPKWWDDITAYLKSGGVVTYEQDWCDRIYRYSPAFSRDPDTAETFLNEMARACRERGLTMQYCMPYPCFFLQGAHYENLTTIRTSGDRFNPNKWNNFLYVSRLAGALRIWPWADVFNSTETNNLLLADLSAGPVGTGDAMGAEDPNNLYHAIRADGVIVKPDVPIVPLDSSYIADAQGAGAPLVAGTFTDHGGLRTGYVFAFNRPGRGGGEIHFSPAELGLTNRVCVCDYFAGTVIWLKAGANFTAPLGQNAVAFYLVASPGRSGITFLGDQDKFVATGKQRIASLHDEPGSLTAKVLFAAGEKSVTLHGYSATVPRVAAEAGQAGPLRYDVESRHFTVQITSDASAPATDIGGDAVRAVTVRFQTGQAGR